MTRRAFVLAGGGTKGAFEAGALAHLVGGAGLVPDVITGASAGSLLALVLAQARGAEELSAAVDEIRDDLLAMSRTDLVFAEQPWLADLHDTPFGKAVNGFVTERTRPPLPDAAEVAGLDLTATGEARRHHRRWHDMTCVLAELPALSRARKHMRGNLSSILTLDPLEAALRGTADVGIHSVDPQRIARPGVDLRLAVTALQAGCTHFVTGDGTIVGPDARTPVAGSGPGTVDAVEGSLASSSVPLIFPPRAMGDDVYADGGCLQNIPLASAFALGAEEVTAIVAVPLQPPRKDVDFTKANLVQVYLRTSEIGFADTQITNLAVTGPPGSSVTVVAPTVDVVGPFEVQQGLMLLDMDYGRMRAEEATADCDDDQRARAIDASDSITVARELVWHLEELGADEGPNAAAGKAAIEALHERIRSALDERAAAGFTEPPGADAWVSGPEHHGSDRPD